MVCGAVSGVPTQQQHASGGLQMGHGAVAGDGGKSKESGVRLSEGLGGGRPRWRRGQVPWIGFCQEQTPRISLWLFLFHDLFALAGCTRP